MKTTKKLLSVLLAVVMLMTSMSVCFGTVSFAASGTPSNDQWNALYEALKADSVKNASFSTVNGKYTVDDPDGNVLKAVEAYFNVFDTLANKTPTTGNPNNTSNSTGSTEGNRVIQQVNASIKNYVAANMPGYEAAMGTFISNILGTASVSTGTGATQTVGGSTTNDKNLPTNNLADVAPINLTVVSSSAITGYTLADLPDSVVTEKNFTVTHAKDRYDYTYATGSTGGCNSKTTYTRTYKFYYYINGVSGANGSAISTQVIKNTQAVLEANAAYFSYTLDQFVELGFNDTSAITDIKKAVVDAKKAVTDAFSGSVYNHFFSAYNVEALSALVDKAVEIITASGIAMDLNDIVEAGYAEIITDKGALEALANNIKTLADKYDAYAADVKAYVESHEYEGEHFDRAAVTAFYNAVIREIELIELRNLKAAIEAEIGTFVSYTDEQVADKIVTGTDLNYAKGKVDGWISALNTYADANVAEVWEGEDIDAFLAGVSANLEYLITVNGYTDSFANEYAYYVSTVYGNTNIDADSADLLAAVKAYDSWYTGLKNLVNNIEYNLDADLADRILKTMDDEMKAHLDSKYNALHTRVLAQIDVAYELYNLLLKDDLKISIVNLNTFAKFEKAFDVIEKDVYDFLIASANFAMPQETIDKYNALGKVGLNDYHNFLETGGFDKFQQTEIPDFTRAEADDTHDAHKGDFTVTDAKVEKIIDVIEKLLADEEIKALLGNLINKDEEGNPTGEPFDLAALLNGVIDGLFTDDLLNTIMGFLYPAVTKEFAKVWAGLPESITVEDIDTGFLGIKADVTAYLDLYTVEKATHAIGMSIFPIELAEKLRAAYPQYEAVAAVLDDVTIASAYQLNGDGDEDDTYNGDPWKDEKLYKTVLDEEGNPVLNDDGTEKTALNFAWGIDEAENKRTAFIDAAVAALSGLEPLLLALLSNQYYESTNKIGTGSGSASVPILGALNLSVDPIDLVFKVSNNPGYNNVLAPVFELLGIEAPNGNNLTTTRKVLEDGLFAPLDAFIAKLAANPVETILEVLPNAMYAISAGRILPLLDMLKINIEYTTNATYSVIGLINGSMNDVYKSEEPIKINVKDMINLEDMGLDLSFDGIWSMITGMLPEGVSLPEIEAGYLATLGALTWKDTKRSDWTYTPVQAGKAAYIEAEKADVLIYLVRYLLNALGENPGLLSALGLELSDDVKAIITGVTADPDKTIAALVELFNAVEYDSLKEYVWYVSELNEDTVVGMTPAIQQYLGYDNNWTKETATYLVENVDAIIGAVMAMVGGEDAEPFSISATLSDLIGGLFTNKNITAIAKLLSKLDLNALLAGDAEAEEGTDEEIETVAEEAALDVNALVNKFAGLDLSGFAAYAELADDATWGFEDGDKAGFVNALAELLAPLSPVLDFILAGENLALLGGDVELIGYNGYDSAIVPLLEALGATPAALAEGENALTAVLNALLARVDAIVADPVDEILGLIPSLLYFVKSNGLTTAVRNLLQPVLVILETIDPVYALNLNELIGGLTKDLGFTIDLGNLGFEAIFDILGAVVDLDLSELEEIIDDVCEVITAKDYASASSIIGANGKKGAYGEFFDAADLLTVLVSFALSWVQEGNNANDIVALIAGDDAEKAAEIQKYITGAITIIGGIDPEYLPIDWAYNFPADYADSIFESGLTIQPTINTINYPTNWTEDTAKYVAENLDEIVDEIIGLIDENYATLADFIADKLTIYSTENVNAIVELVAGLLEDIDDVLIDTVGLVLGADIDALRAYQAPADIDTGAEFAAALADILGTIKPVVDWLFFGADYAFFSKNGTDLVTIKGAEGYAYGLAPILEALGVDAPAKDEATVENVLAATFDRVDAILADPVNEAFDLLPNLVYFLNANGVSVSVQNLLAGVTGLMGALKDGFGVEVDLITVFNDLLAGLLPEDSTVTLDVANLDLESIFALVQELLGINLAPIADILVDLCVGNIVVYTSASGEYGFKMQYSDDFAKYDMITIIVSCFLQIIKLEDNKETIEGMVGEEVYEGILNVISLNINVPVQDFSWAFTESADTGEVFSVIGEAGEFENYTYGEIYTEEMAQYIADNFGEFVTNIIILLGLDVNGDGKSEADFAGVINGALGGSLYNSDIVITIRDAVAGLAETLETSLPAGAHILEILRTAEIADIKGVADVEVEEFDNDREKFVAALCDVLAPLYPVLEWLLADTDLTFFIDEEMNTLITLPGAEGYAYGLIPVLEALGCEDILTPAEYYAAVEADGGVLLTSILNPLLDRIDYILANDAAQEILDMLTNLIYFINSNGVDTVVKNTLNAVYTLLNAIEPIAKIDLYELIGLDLAVIDFRWIMDKLFELLANAGYEFSMEDIDYVNALTVGTLESYTSANGKTAYRMVYANGEVGDKKELVTAVLSLGVTFLANDQNKDVLIGLLEDNLGMGETASRYADAMIGLVIDCINDTQLGGEAALATLYYVFYGVDTGIDNTVAGKNNIDKLWQDALAELRKENNAAGDLIEEILGWEIFDDLIDSEGLAPNGLIAFFQKIISIFQRIVEWFKNLFN